MEINEVLKVMEKLEEIRMEISNNGSNFTVEMKLALEDLSSTCDDLINEIDWAIL